LGSAHFPRRYRDEGLLEIGPIKFGIVEEPGDDIDANPPFNKCNLEDFIDKTGYFNLVKFLGFNCHVFPFLYKLSCCLVAMRMNEVGCERFFSIAGYVSNPRRTRLKVRHYEAMAMLKRNIQQIFIDKDWVVEQYKALEKPNKWDSLKATNDQLVADLEAEIYADDIGIPLWRHYNLKIWRKMEAMVKMEKNQLRLRMIAMSRKASLDFA
jgi:hAT family C-terminal dimerisation region